MTRRLTFVTAKALAVGFTFDLSGGGLMRRPFLSTLFILLFASAGCVSNDSAGNYLPRSHARDKAFHKCLKEAQQIHSSGGIFVGSGGGFGSTNTSVETNHQLLCSCMSSEGYHLREPDLSDVVVSTVLLPIVFLMAETYDCY